MAKRRIADIVHQAGHFNDAFERPGELIQPVALQQLLFFQAAQHLFSDIAANLLNLQGVGQTGSHRGVALQRENLGFLLQPADRRRVDDAPTIAFENSQDFTLRLNALR